MPSGSAWEREALTVKQIPTLQALLRCCDEKLLIRVIIEEHAARVGDWEVLSAKRRRMVEKRLSSTIATMRGLPLDKKRAKGNLLLPCESFVLHARSGLIERRVSAALVMLDDARCARRALDRLDAVSSGDVEAAPGETEGPLPRAYTFEPWERTLAFRTWLGGSWCCRERYLVLASAFWEMTYLGFEYERVCARRAEEQGRRMAEQESPGEDLAGSLALTASDERRRQSKAFGLVEPDLFEQDYFDRLAACVDRLNDGGRRALWSQLLDVAERLGGAEAAAGS